MMSLCSIFGSMQVLFLVGWGGRFAPSPKARRRSAPPVPACGGMPRRGKGGAERRLADLRWPVHRPQQQPDVVVALAPAEALLGLDQSVGQPSFQSADPGPYRSLDTSLCDDAKSGCRPSWLRDGMPAHNARRMLSPEPGRHCDPPRRPPALLAPGSGIIPDNPRTAHLHALPVQQHAAERTASATTSRVRPGIIRRAAEFRCLVGDVLDDQSTNLRPDDSPKSLAGFPAAQLAKRIQDITFRHGGLLFASRHSMHYACGADRLQVLARNGMNPTD